MKKIILLVLIMLIVIPLVSAADWDNVLDYENNDLTVKITNWFGLFGWLGLDDNIGTTELKSHPSVDYVKRVWVGNSVVMWYDFNFVELYPDGLGDVVFTDMRTGGEIERDYSFVYWGEKERNVYGDGKCSYNVNGTTTCETIVVGKETYFDWLPYNSRDIPKESSRIGVRVNTKLGSITDGVWTIAGKKITKHAVWNVSTAVFVQNEDVSVESGSPRDLYLKDDGTKMYVSDTDGNDVDEYALGTAWDISSASYTDNLAVTGSQGMFIDASGDRLFVCEVDKVHQYALGTSWDISTGSFISILDISGEDSLCTGIHLSLDGTVMYITGDTDNDITGYDLSPAWNITTASPSQLFTVGRGEINPQGAFLNIDGSQLFVVGLGTDTVIEYVLSTNWNVSTAVYTQNVSVVTQDENPVGIYFNASGNKMYMLGASGNDVNEYNLAVLTVAPVVDILFPLSITYNETTTQLNYTATTDNTEDRCWNSRDDGVTNSTDVAFGTNFTLSSINGANTFTVFCNDTNSTIGQDSVTFFVNKSVVTDLIIPVNNSNFTVAEVTFSIESTPVNTDLANMTLNLFLANGTFLSSNFTSLSGTSKIQTNFTNSFNDGIYIWNAETCGDNVDCDLSENRTFEIHTTPSTIIINFPRGNIDSFATGSNLTLNWTILEPGQNLTTHIINCSYTYNSIETFLPNASVCIETNETSFLYVNGVNNLTFTVVEEFDISSTNSTSWTFSFLETGVDFNVNVSETASETFDINLTTDISVLSISAKLRYNGTNHSSDASCVGGACTISNTIDIPLVSTGEAILYNFSWIIDIFNGTDSSSITTSVRQQNVSRIHVEECDATFTVKTLNFTVYDEQTLERISSFTFDGAFDSWLGSGAITRNSSMSNNVTEMILCLIPNKTITIDAIIDYDEDVGTNYTNRFYYFDNHDITNTTQHIFMYLLKSTTSTSFILKVQDDSLLPVADAIIEIHRFYPGTNEFRIVQIAKTDDNGKSVGFFETETVDYKFIIKKNGEILLETGQQKVIPETSPFTLTFNIGEPLGEPWESQEELDEFNSSLTWDDSTGIVTYIYIDSSGNFSLARLIVIKESLVNLTADETICNENSTLTSATLTCTVGSDNGFYLASTFITRNSVETLDRQFTFQIETLSGVVGLLGLFFGWFLILIASFMFKFNEIAGIWAITVTVFLVNLMGLISFGNVFVTATIAVAIILTWVMEK